MAAQVKTAGVPKFLIVGPQRYQLMRYFVDMLEAQGTAVVFGTAEASWARGLVERHRGHMVRWIRG